ncbi:MAG: GAF domain-containing protein [Ardenticatenaceae bacterium]|nr:GAF domain-containing protein [Ardenticatenaceae bacterium]MCB8947785.1 GAF domain-containing protein [Ardenticatenaceae bacterium]
MEKELTSAMIWSLFDSLHEGILIAETDGKILYLNEAAGDLLGLSPEATSLQALSHLFTPSLRWQDCLTPPFATPVALANGRLLNLHTHPIELGGENLVQIVLTPDTDATDLVNATQALRQLTNLTHVNNETDLQEQLTLLVSGLQKTGWNRVLLSLRDETFNPTLLIAAGISDEEKKFLQNNMIPAKTWLSLFEEETSQQYRHGGCYFVPGTSTWTAEHLGMVLADKTAVPQNGSTWHPNDLLCVPLHNQQKERIGLIGLDQPTNGRRPTTITLQMIELYAQFAAVIIENAQLFQQAVNRNREFELLLNNSTALSSTLDKTAILNTLAQQTIEASNAAGCTIYQWLPEAEMLVVLTDMATDNKTAVSAAGTRLPFPDSPVIRDVLKRQQTHVLYLDETESPLPLPGWATGTEQMSTLVPIVLTGETYGFIQLLGENGRLQNTVQHELKLLIALVNQAATALEIALIFEDTYERERFYGAMGNVSMALNSSLDRETVLNLICSEGRRIFNADGAYIWQLEGEQLVGSAAAGHGADEFIGSTIPVTDEVSFVVKLAQSGEPTYINRLAEKDQIEVRLPHAEQIQSVLGVPLQREDDLNGILILADTNQANRFTNKDVSWATTFGVQVAIALQNAKLFEEQREFNETLDQRVAERTRALNDESNRVKILLRITSELSASLDQDRVLNQALHLVNGVVNAKEGAILLIDQESGEFIFQAAIGSDRPIPLGGIPSGMMRNEGLAGWMIENRSAVILHDAHEDPRWLERETSLKHRSVLGVPLISNEDEEVIGVLMMFHTEPSAFTNQQLDLVEAAAIQVANAINNASLYKLIFEQAEQLGSMLRTEIIQKANLEAILESIADGVIVADNRNHVDIANLPACNILDIPRDQLLGKSINELLGLYGHFGESWIHTINDWAHNADRIEQWTYLADQLVIEDKFVSVHLSPVLSDNQFYGTVSIFRDITKEVEVDKLKSEFVSTVSHELRTPMTSIKGYADLMLMGAAGKMTDPQIRYLQVIKNNADRLHMLVNDLLDISRIETGKTGLDLRPLDIPQIIEQVVDGHLNGRIQHESRHLDVETEIAPALPLVNADHARVTQILTNLLDNALNYTPDDGHITITATATHSYVHISVKDTGIGIAKENQEKIFDRFYRAEDADVQRVPGTGLGLAIVRSLIEMHGGRLKVESELGKGSTFTFNIPVVIEDSDPT